VSASRFIFFLGIRVVQLRFGINNGFLEAPPLL
jgi:hypothetical protein